MEPEIGNALWAELHTYAWIYPEAPTEADQDKARAWLADFTRRVRESSAGRCGCSDHWQNILLSCPPALQTRRDFYWWTVAAHDFINQRLGRDLYAPEWSLQHTLFTSL